MPNVSDAALAALSHIPLAGHLHGGTVCTDDSPPCPDHPGERVKCTTEHIPFFGDVHLCIHHV